MIKQRLNSVIADQLFAMRLITLGLRLVNYKSCIYLLNFITAHALDLLMPVKVR